LLTESVLLALAGGIVGLFAIWVSLRVFDSRIPDIEILIDWPVMLFVFGVATVAGLLFGISPALHATRLSVGEVLKNSSEGVIAGRLRLQSLLVVAQIALTQPVLLALGALVLEVRGELREVPRSAYADRLIELHYNMNPRYGAMDARREAGVERAKESLSRLPGVTSVVRMPSRDLLDVRVHPADRAPAQDIPDLLILDGHAADAGYFELTGRSFVRGRDFDGAQRDSAGAIVIGSTLARRLWGAADPVGRRFVPAFSQTDVPATYTVVGVIDDDATAPAADQRPRVFIPPRGATEHLLIRTHGPADELLGQVRSAAHAAAPELPVTFATTLASSEAAMRRLYLRGIYAVGTGGGLALLLSAIGLYAVVAFSVGQRIREIGIRAALGASNRQVVRLFVRRGMVLGVIGLVIGSILSIVGARLLALALGEEPATGLFALSAVVGAIVLCVAFLATWLPARSALRVDPINVLRAE
jgi:predicted permease